MKKAPLGRYNILFFTIYIFTYIAPPGLFLFMLFTQGFALRYKYPVPNGTWALAFN
jgi:hypothetical protein